MALPTRPLLLALLGSSLFAACDSSDETATTPVTYEISVAQLDGGDPEAAVALRCDGTLAIAVRIAPEDQFSLRPANACGESTRCGYVHIEGLSDGDSEPLASVDTATTEGVLELTTEDIAKLTRIRARLIRGIDRQPVLTPEGDVVEDTISPSFVVPMDCPEEVPSAGGAPGGGAGGEGPNEPSSAGAGGQPGAGGSGIGTGGAPELAAGGAAAGGAAPDTGGASPGVGGGA